MEYTVILLEYITVGVRHTVHVVCTYGKQINDDQDKQVQRAVRGHRQSPGHKDTTINHIAYAQYVLNMALCRVRRVFVCTGNTGDTA